MEVAINDSIPTTSVIIRNVPVHRQISVPSFNSLEECLDHCTDLMYNCRLLSTAYFCELNPNILLAVVVLAVLTGVLIPTSCIMCYMCGVCEAVGQFLCPHRPEAEALLHNERRSWDVSSFSDLQYRRFSQLQPRERQFHSYHNTPRGSNATADFK
ncbi:hypothetical protein AAVH_06066 [Aphelenchoides avenae]|nr:hypothetical protein AAVH_06066 [Aphelenchus avenae]